MAQQTINIALGGQLTSCLIERNSGHLQYEATYQEALRDKARDHQRFTALQAAQIAKKVGVKQLFLT